MLFSSFSGRINIACSYYFIPEYKTGENAVVDFYSASVKQTNLDFGKETHSSASTTSPALTTEREEATFFPRMRSEEARVTVQGTALQPMFSHSYLTVLLPTSQNFSQLLSEEKDQERETKWKSSTKANYIFTSQAYSESPSVHIHKKTQL